MVVSQYLIPLGEIAITELSSDDGASAENDCPPEVSCWIHRRILGRDARDGVLRYLASVCRLALFGPVA